MTDPQYIQHQIIGIIQNYLCNPITDPNLNDYQKTKLNEFKEMYQQAMEKLRHTFSSELQATVGRIIQMTTDFIFKNNIINNSMNNTTTPKQFKYNSIISSYPSSIQRLSRIPRPTDTASGQIIEEQNSAAEHFADEVL